MATKIVASKSPNDGNILIAETPEEVEFISAIRDMDEVATGYLMRVMRATASGELSTAELQSLSGMSRDEMFAFIDNRIPA